MPSVTYEHTKTKQTATYPQPNRRLEKSDDWKRVNRKAAAKKSDDSKS